ncbi:MAG: methionine adenosyltransferase [Acidobacteria bacterium 21-70-11]|nr:MAG: methionine adenosyltransferase [Acidobacteria bacterium 21-70-11]
MNNRGIHVFTSESVTEGHPDKVCDQISDAVLDEVLRQDIEKETVGQGRVACESFITVGLVIVGGEITTDGWVDVQDLVRDLIRRIGYTDIKYGFNYATCGILNAIGRQSGDIAQGVDTGGAGDQGLMIGYACDETAELMPMPITLAHKLTRRLAEVRRKGVLPYLGPDGKSQVTVEYRDGKPHRIDTVVISSQHTKEILNRKGDRITAAARDEIVEKVGLAVLPKKLVDAKTRFLVNPTGKFVIGGPQSDTGMTGRKIIVDTYGGWAPHGGGAFSGKDPTKVDRSATYMARHIAKNIVGAKLAREALVQLAYAIGVADPVSVMVDTSGTGVIPDDRLTDAIREVFPLTPRGIIAELDLLRPIYRMTASYGHFGRSEPEFRWESLHHVDELKAAAAKLA